MSTRSSLRRLHELRRAEEEQRRALLQSTIEEMNLLESSLRSAQSLAARGRALLLESVRTGDTEDRLSGIEEIDGAKRLQKVLSVKILAAEHAIEKARENLLAKRAERRQTGTLLASMLAEEQFEQKRKAQVALDDWYLSRKSARERESAISAGRCESC